MAPVATEFDKIIQTARERKRNEALADKIFSAGRRQSAPGKLKPVAGGSLASRVGVKKPQQTHPRPTLASQNRRASVPAGNVNGEWTHDLHSTVNSSSGSSLGSRITRSGEIGNGNAAQKAAKKRADKLAAALDRMDTDDLIKKQVNVIAPKPAKRDAGISIRGLAGPFAVMGQNFAPGTTAADIESAMTPVGGDMVSCKIVKTQPFIIVEMIFSSREGGERVIETFNNKTADGRIIQVYPKPGGYQTEKRNVASSSTHSNGSNTAREQVVDGKLGFADDLMAVDNTNDNRLRYSDRVGGAANNKRGRGFQRGRGGR